MNGSKGSHSTLKACARRTALKKGVPSIRDRGCKSKGKWPEHVGIGSLGEGIRASEEEKDPKGSQFITP